jgi:hypothetical protein
MTWICCNCHEPHSDEFNQCWNCGTDSNGIPSPDFAQYFKQLSDAEYDDLLLGQLPVPVLVPVPINRLRVVIADHPPHKTPQHHGMRVRNGRFKVD